MTFTDELHGHMIEAIAALAAMATPAAGWGEVNAEMGRMLDALETDDAPAFHEALRLIHPASRDLSRGVVPGPAGELRPKEEFNKELHNQIVERLTVARTDENRTARQPDKTKSGGPRS